MPVLKWLTTKVLYCFHICIHLQIFFRIDSEFTGKYLCWDSLFNKVADLQSVILLKQNGHRCFPVNLAKFLRTLLLTEHLPLIASKLKNILLCSVNSFVI